MKRSILAIASALTFASAGTFTACSDSSDSQKSGTTSTPTDVVISWTIAGEAPTDASCADRGGVSVYVSLSGTIDTELHQDTTVGCAVGSVTFPGLIVEDLGQPYVDAMLLDASGKTVSIASGPVVATAKSTELTLDFFPKSPNPSTTSSTSSSSSVGAGGAGGAGGGGAGGAGGQGGAPSTSSNTTGSGGGGSTSSSSSASSTSTTGAGGAGGASGT